MSIVRLGSTPTLLHSRTVATQTQSGAVRGLDRTETTLERGDWGEIVDIQRIAHPIDVIGLGAPDAPEAKATASITYSVKGGGGLKLSVGIATVGVTASYTVEQGLELPGENGAASVGTILLPVNRLTQRFRPDDSTEWFERWRYELVMLDPVYPNLGAVANSVPADLLFAKRHIPGSPVGGGSAPVNQTTSRSVEVEVSLEIGLPLTAEKEGPSLTLSASLTGSVAVEISYELPKDAAFELFWLEGIAGACFVKR